MKPSLKYLTAVAGITCVTAAAPAAQAGAATPSTAGGTPLLPGLSCSVNQGLLPGIPNLGPTGPLGPLGSSGPLGGNGNNLPCGLAAINLGPSGPLGPGGALGSQQPAPQPAPQSASNPSSGRQGNGHAGTRGKHPGRGRTRKHRHAGHTQASPKHTAGHHKIRHRAHG